MQHQKPILLKNKYNLFADSIKALYDSTMNRIDGRFCCTQEKLTHQLNPRIFGRRFEQFVICQLMARIHYKRLDLQFYYWRTNHGAEVDLLLCAGNRIVCALEIISSHNIVGEQLGGLKSFIKDNPGIPAYVLGAGQSRRRLHDDITVISWDEYILEELEVFE